MKNLQVILVTVLFAAFTLTSFADGNGTKSSSSEGKIVKLFKAGKEKLKNTINVEFEIQSGSKVRLLMVNEDGACMKVLEDGEKPAGKYSYKVNRDELEDGDYTLFLETDYEIKSSYIDL